MIRKTMFALTAAVALGAAALAPTSASAWGFHGGWGHGGWGPHFGGPRFGFYGGATSGAGATSGSRPPMVRFCSG